MTVKVDTSASKATRTPTAAKPQPRAEATSALTTRGATGGTLEPGGSAPYEAVGSVPPMDVEIRALEGGEWELFKDLRLRALVDAPDAFRGTHAEERSQSDRHWQDMVRRTAEHAHAQLYLAIVDDAACGTAFVRVDHDHATAHIGAMWVAPEARGRGAGSQLLEAAFTFARAHGARHAELAVTHDNGPAEQLYASAGFESTGRTEPLRDGSALSVQWMRRPL